MACHNLTLILMTGSLLSGLALAIGHHFFYDYLNDRIVESQNQQEWFLRIGTGLAFLVRALLSAAVGIAYTQILWRTLRSKSITIQGIDSLFGVSHTAWDFTTLELWTAAPALAVVAVIAWALPLIAVITPATLSIEISSEANVTTIDGFIPRIDYDRTLWFGRVEEDAVYVSTHISRLVTPVASLGSILPITAPFPNSSYSVGFYGPALSCDTPENDSFREAMERIVNVDRRSERHLTYAGFVPVSENKSSSASEEGQWHGYAIEGLYNILDETYYTPEIDFTANVTDRNPGGKSATFFVLTPDRPGGRANKTIECQLYNATYSANITFDNGLQDIKYKTEKLNGVSVYDTRDCVSKPGSRCNPVTAYLTIMAAMGTIVVGTQRDGGFTERTRISQTVLLDSPDMHMTYYDEKPKSLIGNLSMPYALEQLFENVTTSLLSDSQFLNNDTTASRGPITRFSAQNAFSYEPRNLFIAYGIGILFSLIVVIFGFLCIKSASASYTNSFSTILRTTRNTDLDTIVTSTETSGAEPLSKEMGNVRLTLRRQGRGLEGGGGSATAFAVDAKPEDEKGSREERPTESLLKPDRGNRHSDVDEISTTQEGSEFNLNYKREGNTVVTSND
ncbi:uncharacterized protein B0J16DRAFT_305840 [Fusarium flagelliforme]|uniref:uncharacterized protein n=1 Tax=Fusarium flagelliforme TaxID=2675880 RepID=UPI001E8DB2E2|nr:uncharacterized protein B0J16DRAFT_305840 [Fusarium flagelliforme]KAH7186164.1 hypothetical protein B0J16DRAFT_305840 [Fusarium flagelliforme]